MPTAIITITDGEGDNTNVTLEFHPSLNEDMEMSGSHILAFRAMAGMRDETILDGMDLGELASSEHA